MAVQTVTQSVANAAEGSFAYKMAVIVNALAALANEVKADLNVLRNVVLNHATEPANFEIDTNYDIRNGDAFHIIADGEPVLIATEQNFDTGTSASTAIDTWIAALLSIDGDATTHVDYTAGGHASEAAAIIALASITASGAVVCGYVTILTASGTDWEAGTDALQGGTGGDVSADTNYVNLANSGDAAIGAAASSTDADTLTFRATGTPT